MFSRHHKVWLVLIIMAVMSLLVLTKHSWAQSNVNGDNGDAIAVRIIPNPNHFSITRWYENQGFQGSPQSLVVDGYEAIRDGRTVYVNAANVTSTSIYTNIYLISYNQDSAVKTTDILGQLIAHWKFNNNLEETGSPSCAISALGCASDSDCPTTAQCATSSAGSASSSCILKKTVNCLVDTDCPSSFFCSSLKSKISRDMQRLGRVSDLEEAIIKYKERNSNFPSLTAGTYLANYSVSTWPSWSETFLSNIVAAQSLVDPINRLGSCSGYDLKTCWNNEQQQFVNAPTSNALELPAGSYALVYSSDKSGLHYNLCSTLETKSTAYRFSPYDPIIGSSCLVGGAIVGAASNTPPRLVSQSLNGLARQEFSGYVEVTDDNGDPLTWSLDTSGVDWTGWNNGQAADAPPVLKDTSNPEQKIIYAQLSGAPKTYNINLIVSDGHDNGTVTIPLALKIVSSVPFIEAENAQYVVDPVTPFNYSFFFTSSHLQTPSNPTDAYTVTKVSGPFDLLNEDLTKSAPALSGVNRYQVKYSGLVNSGRNISQDTDWVYKITVTDKDNNVSFKTFKIKLVANTPPLEINCDTGARKNWLYSCGLGSAQQGNFTLSYALTGLPHGLSWSGTSINGTPDILGSSTIKVKVTDNYQASSTKSFSLQVNNYCGDGVKQIPNTEGRGGLYNDGYEDCDGNDGITNDVASSSPDLQYGCQTEATGTPSQVLTNGTTTPKNILTNGYCVFKSPVQFGGYCGDGYCQSETSSGGNLENCWNCPSDCGVCQTSDVLTNNDFEGATTTLPSGIVVPVDWSGWHQLHSMLGISTSTHRSGLKSVFLHQDSGYDFPGVCNQYCNNIASVNGDTCSYVSVSPIASSTCSFSHADDAHLVAPAVYHQGESLSSYNANHVMWGDMVYNMDKLPFKSGDIYLVSFYYRGTTTNPITVGVAPSLGWFQQCLPFSSSIALRPGYTYNASTATITPTLAPWDNPCAFNQGNICKDQPGYCCQQAPYQTKCFSGFPVMKPIDPGVFSTWHQYVSGFQFGDQMASWFLAIPTSSPYVQGDENLPWVTGTTASTTYTNGYRPQIEFGVNMNYGSTGSGTDMYFDDFSVKKVIIN
jgi:hypothetical protein